MINRSSDAIDEELQAALNFKFSQPEYLRKALLHPSHPHAHAGPTTCQFQRLEFLGDRVLNLIVAKYLHDNYPEAKEGDLSKQLSYFVSADACRQIAKLIQLEKYLKTAADGNRDSKILADGVEALLGAVYCDGGENIDGMAACEKIVTESWIPFLKNSGAYSENTSNKNDDNYNYNYNNKIDAKGELQKLTQSQIEKCIPKYDEVLKTGPDHRPTFHVIVHLDDLQYTFEGCGNTKKLAENMAASNALKALGQNPQKNCINQSNRIEEGRISVTTRNSDFATLEELFACDYEKKDDEKCSSTSELAHEALDQHPQKNCMNQSKRIEEGRDVQNFVRPTRNIDFARLAELTAGDYKKKDDEKRTLPGELVTGTYNEDEEGDDVIELKIDFESWVRKFSRRFIEENLVRDEEHPNGWRTLNHYALPTPGFFRTGHSERTKYRVGFVAGIGRVCEFLGKDVVDKEHMLSLGPWR